MTTIGDCGPHSAGSSKSNDELNDDFDDFDEIEDDVPITGLGGKDNCLPRNSILHVVKKKEPQEQQEQPRTKLAGLNVSTSTTTFSSTLTSTNTLSSTNDCPRHESTVSNVSETSTVTFGDKVRVHKHRMTLGDNPSANGIPITIAWEADDSEEIDLNAHVERQQERQQERLQKFQEQQELDEEQQGNGSAGGGALLRPMGPQRRLKIARENHRIISLKNVLNGTRKIQNSRIASREENIETAIETEQNQQKRKDRRTRIASRLFLRSGSGGSSGSGSSS